MGLFQSSQVQPLVGFLDEGESMQGPGQAVRHEPPETSCVHVSIAVVLMYNSVYRGRFLLQLSGVHSKTLNILLLLLKNNAF